MPDSCSLQGGDLGCSFTNVLDCSSLLSCKTIWKSTQFTSLYKSRHQEAFQSRELECTLRASGDVVEKYKFTV